jgi:hypothetical protein
MLSEVDSQILYGLEAVERVIKQGILWKEVIEAIHVMRLEYHEHAAKHFKNFGKDHEATRFLGELEAGFKLFLITRAF